MKLTKTHAFEAAWALRVAWWLLVPFGAPHDVHVRVGGAGPHDVGSGIAMRCRKSCCFRVKGPHDHPVRGDRNCRAGLVIWIGIAPLSRTREHVCYPWNSVGWLGFMSGKVSRPLHRWSVGAHRRIADDLRIAWHASEAVGAFTYNYGASLRILCDDFR